MMNPSKDHMRELSVQAWNAGYQFAITTLEAEKEYNEDDEARFFWEIWLEKYEAIVKNESGT